MNREITTPIKGMKTIPEFCDDSMLAGAFVDLVRFALGEKEIVDQFEKETAKKLTPKMIPAFADWVNKTMWGDL